MVMTGALYGLASSGAAWHATLAETMRALGHKPCKADPDVWMKEGMTKDNHNYWQCALIYVNDCTMHHEEVSKWGQALKHSDACDS